MLVQHPEVVQELVSARASIESAHPIVHLPETVVMDSIARAGKAYVLHGRDAQRTARFGAGELLLMSSPGQHAWFDTQTEQMRPATLDDARKAIRLGDALPNISIVGAMAQPAGMNERFREVLLAAELIKGTTKPTRSWVSTVETARFVLELFRTVAGGEAALRARPMTKGFLTPISPLQFPEDGLAVLREFIRTGQPVCIASMPMATGTAPVTLAGAMAVANAEFLADNVVTQQLGPGTPILYGGIPHIMDPRTTLCSFGAPEQRSASSTSATNTSREDVFADRRRSSTWMGLTGDRLGSPSRRLCSHCWSSGKARSLRNVSVPSEWIAAFGASIPAGADSTGRAGPRAPGLRGAGPWHHFQAARAGFLRDGDVDGHEPSLHHSPHFGSAGMTANGFTIQLSASMGCNYVILASTNLKDWTPISTNVALTGTLEFADSSATNLPSEGIRQEEVGNVLSVSR